MITKLMFWMRIVVLTILLASCASNKYLIGNHVQQGEKGQFVVVTSKRDVINKVESQLSIPINERYLFLIGIVAEGDDGYNTGWSWHIEPESWDLVEFAIELCDATPEMVEEDLASWVGRQFCPWSSYVARELP